MIGEDMCERNGKVDGTVNGVNGIVVNGIGVDGIGVDGIVVNGIVVNGIGVDGIGVDGIELNEDVYGVNGLENGKVDVGDVNGIKGAGA